jgi:ABC-type transport system involved in multi-copper enzyme maturation permease subunit
VREGSAEIALIAGASFEEDVRSGRDPALTVIVPRTASSTSAFAEALVDPALRALAGQQLPARIALHTVDTNHHDPIDQLGTDRFKLLLVIVYLIANVALILVPTLVAEEHEQGTLDALLMVGSPLDVGAAKALVGITAVSLMVVLTVNLGDITPADGGLFAAGALLLAVVLIGFGLLVGALLRTTARVNIWMGLLILPVIAPAALLGLSMPAPARLILSLTPTAEATRLLANGLTGESVYSQPALSVLGLLAWGAIAYALLVRTLARREA